MSSTYARLAISVAGAVVGAYFGMPAVGFAIGSVIGALAFPDKVPASLNDSMLMTSAYGQGIPILYGTARLAGNVIWADPNKKSKNQSGKGGLGGSGNEVYKQSFAVAFCEGPCSDVIRIWCDGKLVLDKTGVVTNTNTIKVNGSKVKLNLDFRFYGGQEDQLPDPVMQYWVSMNVPDAPLACPAYRGLCYIFFQDFPISDFGGRIPNITAEIASDTTPYIPASKITLATKTISPTDTAGLGCAVDWIRGVYYSYSNNLIRVVEMSTGTEILCKAVSNNWLSICCGQDGSLFCTDASSVQAYDEHLTPLNYGRTITANPLDAFIGGPCYLSNFGTGSDALFGATASRCCWTSPEGTGVEFVVVTGGRGAWAVVNQNGVATYQHAAGYLDYTNLGAQSAACTVKSTTNLNDTDLANNTYGFGDATSSVYLFNWGSDTSATMGLYLMTFDGGTSPLANPINPLTGLPIGMTFTKLTELSASMFDPSLPSSTPVSFKAAIADDTDGGLVLCMAFGSVTYTVKYYPEGGQIVWVNEGTDITVLRGIDNSVVSNGTLGFANAGVSSNTFTLMDTRTGKTIYSGPVTDPPSLVFNNSSGWNFYNSDTQIITTVQNSGAPQITAFLNGGTAADAPLSAILQDCCYRADLTFNQFDTTLMTQRMGGYVINQSAPVKNVFKQLQQAFFFDVVESDYVLKFVPKIQDPVQIIPQIDLASADKKGEGDFWSHKRAQQQETPVQINVNFKNPLIDYGIDSVDAKRVSSPVKTVFGKQKATFEMPIMMTRDQAKDIAATALYMIWAERDTYVTSWGWKYLYLDPSDTVTVNFLNGDSVTARITDMNVGADYTLKVQLIGEDSVIFSDSFIGYDEPYAYAQTIISNGFARLFLFNLPLLRDIDDMNGTGMRTYYGAGPFQAGWSAGGLYQSNDGVNFSMAAGVTNQVTWGTCTTSLPSTTSTFMTDKATQLTVVLSNTSTALTSASDLDFMNGVNAAVIGGTEVIYFQNVAVNSDGTFTLSNLLRGQRGTDWACNSHVVGESFVLLVDKDMNLLGLPLSDLNTTLTYKLVPNGHFLEETPAANIIFLGYDQKPYAPVNFTRTASGSDVVVGWVRRTRFGGPLQDGSGTVPLNEATESYDAYVLPASFPATNPAFDPTKPATYVRAFTGLSSPTFTYTASMMATDGFAPATQTLSIVVFQRSASVGQGFPGWADMAPY